MKASLLVLGAMLATALLSACESDLPPQQSAVPAKLQRGMSGQGTLYQPDRTGDPLIREQTRVGY